MVNLPVSFTGNSPPLKVCTICGKTFNQNWKHTICPACTARKNGPVNNYRYVPVWQLAGELGVSANIIKNAVEKGQLKGKRKVIDGKITDVVQRAESYPFRTNKGEAVNKPVKMIRQDFEVNRKEEKVYTVIDKKVIAYLIGEALSALELLIDYVAEKGE